jgi:hypothetical protein
LRWFFTFPAKSPRAHRFRSRSACAARISGVQADFFLAFGSASITTGSQCLYYAARRPP